MNAPKDLFEAARAARENSYSPYSHAKVGAAIRTASGEIHAGCNVENSSFGGTCCAERTAIFSAIAAHGKVELKEVLVVTDATPPWPPCGICRQVIAEFGPQAQVHVTNLQGEHRSYSLRELLPQAFTPAHLKK